jgi:DNA-binding NtrC family response regulator
MPLRVSVALATHAVDFHLGIIALRFTGCLMETNLEEPTTCLLVEDDIFVSDAYKMVLEDAGIRVCHIAANEVDAIEALLARRPDIALVDVDIEGGDSLGVATALIAKDVAVAFVSGHPHTVLPAPFSGLPFLQKPVTRAALLALAETLKKTKL